MATYYISNSPAGSDSNPGTISQPWLTIGHAVSTCVAGDVINLNGGNTFGNPSFTVGLTIQSYGTGQAIVAGGTGAAITFTNCDGAVVNNISATGATAAYSSGNLLGIIQFLNTTTATQYPNGITVTNCVVNGGGSGQAGIVLVANSTTGANGYQNVTITGNTVSGCIWIGIFLSGDLSGTFFNTHFSAVTVGTLASPNIVHDIVGFSSVAFHTGSGHGIVVMGSNTNTGPVLIQYNLCYSCGASATTGGSDTIWCADAWGTLIQHNIVHDTAAPALADGFGVDIDVNTTGCIAQYNYVYNCLGGGITYFNEAGGGGATSPPNVIRFNLIVNCGVVATKGGIHLDGFVTPVPVQVYYNTVIGSGTSPAVSFYLAPASKGVSLYNNLLIAMAGIPLYSSPAALDASFVSDYNVFMGGNSASPTWSINGTTYTGIAAWRTFSGQDTHSATIAQSPFGYVLPANSTATPGNIASLSQYCPVQGTTGATVLATGANLSTTFSINPGTIDFLGNTLQVNPTFAGCMSVYGSSSNAYEATVYGLDPVVSFRLADSSGAVAYDNALSMAPAALTSVTLGGSAISPIDGGPTAVFNGSSSVATSAQLATAYTLSAFSLEVWIFPTSVAAAAANIICFQNSSVNSCNLLMNTNVLHFFVKDTSSNVVQAHPTTYTVAANTPLHVVGVWSGSNTLALYVNGASQALTYDSTGTPASFQFYQVLIGNQSAFSRFYAGNAGPMNVYQTALTAPQVANLYYSGTPVVQSPRLGCGAALMMCP